MLGGEALLFFGLPNWPRPSGTFPFDGCRRTLVLADHREDEVSVSVGLWRGRAHAAKVERLE